MTCVECGGSFDNPYYRGADRELNGEDWTVIAVAKDESVFVLENINTGKVKIVENWEVSQ